MSTNFFERQASAKKSTVWLLTMFALATVAIVVTVTVVVAIALAATNADHNGQAVFDNGQAPWAIAALCGFGTLLLILGGSFFKIVALRAGGGASVAESLGGVRIYPSTSDPTERRLMNVVEEMSIASGVPVPPVYFLANEAGINAFAAGYSPSDAVLGITRGAAERLTRDELQSVLAHEFSHILNGDMRIGIRVMGVLYGILLMGFVGQLIFRTLAYGGGNRSRSDKGSSNATMVILLIGLALIVLGFVGTFLGNLIKAAISRQRERLADASGVQFTRNPAGLAGALKRIGSLKAGSKLQAPNAAQASHIFFAEGVWKNMAGLWSSHPPLEERIRALDPNWDGKFPAPESNAGIVSHEIATSFSTEPSTLAAGLAPGVAAAGLSGSSQPSASSVVSDSATTNSNEYYPAEIPVRIVDRAIDHVGNPTQAHVDYATGLRALLPQNIVAFAREPYAARAVVLSMLLNQDASIRASQMQALGGLVTPDVAALVKKLSPAIDELDARVRLPLVDVALPALAAMSPSQYRQFIQAFQSLAAADGQLDLFEWVLSQIVIRHLRPHFENARPAPVGRMPLTRLSAPCAVVLSAVAYAGNSNQRAQQAFEAAASQLSGLGLKLVLREATNLTQLRRALSAIAQATPQAQGELVDACAAAISADGHATIEEVELLRGVSDLLDCPMPPLLVNQV
ncbi:MAG: M48 family metallopeptidase [Pirellulaceae bacterium]|nr:M48 family metallopeptidase [Pirellulaceae bacterium]